MAPSATASPDSPPPSNPENQENNNLQPFYVLHKASAQKPERKQGRAKRKIDLSQLSPKKGQKLEAEKDEECDDRHFERLRTEAFEVVWSKIESAIKDVLRNMNTDVFNDIHEWIMKSFEAIRSYGTPVLLERTRSYPIATDASCKQLFAGLVLTKNMEFVDDLLTFEGLAMHLRSNGCHVANLSSMDFSTKNGIGGCLRALLRQLLEVNSDAADISILASWYCEENRSSKPVVVIIDDMDRCNGSVLSDFILMLSEWVIKIPIILMMGSASLEASKNILPANSLQRLHLCKFTLGSPSEKMDSVVKSILVKPCAGFSIGYRVAAFMKNYFQRQDGTLTSFVRALKIACVQHFSTEPLSFMLKWLNSKERHQVLWSENYGLLSKAMHMYAADLPSSGSKIEFEEESSDYLADRLSELERLQKYWSTVVLCLYEAGKSSQVLLLDLFCEALDPDHYISGASELHVQREKCSEISSLGDSAMHQSSHGLRKGGLIWQTIRRVRDLPQVLLHQLLTSCEKLTKDTPEINEKVKELQSLKFEEYKNLKMNAADAFMKNKSHNISMAKESRTINEKVAALLETMVRNYMQPIECIPFHEIVCYRNVDKLQSALIGDARKIIQVDLLEFQKFLHCSCCNKSGKDLLPSMHDTSIMYILAQEHGDIINLHDWYQSFKATVLQTSTKRKRKTKLSPSPKKRKSNTESQSQNEASLQARFCRAVTELQITGLLRMPSKRRPDYVQRVAFGL